MTGDDPKLLKRRDFLISSTVLAGAGWAVPGWAADNPCPPPSIAVAGGTTAQTVCPTTPGQLPKLILTSAAASGVHGWTFGQVFRKGDVPAGVQLTADSPSFQAEVRNRWSDGSVKFAVLSGVTTFTQSQPRAVNLATNSSVPDAPAVAEPSALDVSVSFTGGVSGTYALQSVLGVAKETWGSKATGGRVRRIPGPVMSEFHYYVPTSDPHVSVWFYVRRYSNGATEVETVVENGWLNVAGPGKRDYSVTVNAGGSARYSGTLAHLSHTRWSRADWIGTDPAITPRHDGAYLRSTRLVPNYTTAYGPPSEATLNALPQSLAPFAQGAWPVSMGEAGTSGNLLPNWAALYVTSGDPRAYRCTVVQDQSAGRYGIYHRDETTGNPPLYASYSPYSYGGGTGISGVGSGQNNFPSVSDVGPPGYAKTHAPALGYLSYLLTGRHSFREQVEYQAQVSNWSANSASVYEGARIPVPNSDAFTVRGWGWSMRSFVTAVVCVPDADARAAQYRAQMAKTLAWAADKYTGKNALGLIICGANNYVGNIQNQAESGSGSGVAPWQYDFCAMSVAWAKQVATDTLTGNDKTRAEALADFMQGSIVGRMGAQAGYCYRDAGIYAIKVSDNDDLWRNGAVNNGAAFNTLLYPSWLTVYEKSFGPNTCSSSTQLTPGYSGTMSNEENNYWAFAHAALAFAVDLGYPGATEAWHRFTSAQGYSPQGFNNRPQWGVVPR